MNINSYTYIFIRVNYPIENGYRMEAKPLPPWIHLTISEDENVKYLTVHSRLHIVKENRLNPQYNCEYGDIEILKDLSAKIAKMYL